MSHRLFILWWGILAPVLGCEKATELHEGAQKLQYTRDVPALPGMADVTVRLPTDIKTHLEHRWPVARVREFCAAHLPTDPHMQNLVGEGKYEYGCLLHEDAPEELGTVYWWANSKDGKSWTYTLNVRNGDVWWWLELGSLISETEVVDDPAYRTHGTEWEDMWRRVRAERKRKG